jgi:hypothetical protein
MRDDAFDQEAEVRRLAGVVGRLEARIAAVEDELAAERRAREALEDRLAGLDREGRRSASSAPVRPEPAATATGDDPGRLKSVLADWGFGAKSRQKPSAESPPRPARTSAPGPAPAARASIESSASPQPATPRVPEIQAPPTSPPPHQSPPPARAPTPRQPFNTSAPTLIDALERDPTITPGQRETLRMIYLRFFPDAVPNPEMTVAAGTTVDDVLETDPNLQHGQREALRTMYNSFGAHRRKPA